jgi:hypothetical protein
MTNTFSDVDDPYLPVTGTKWPSVIGWILLCWCGLGVCFGLYGFTLGKSLSTETYLGLPDWMVACIRMLTVVGFLLAILGIVAGWRLRQRRKIAPILVKSWVAASLVLGAAWIAVEMGGRDEMTELIRRNILKEIEKSGQQAPELKPEMPKGIFAAQLGCIGFFSFVPPLVIGGIIMTRSRREEAATWAA